MSKKMTKAEKFLRWVGRQDGLTFTQLQEKWFRMNYPDRDFWEPDLVPHPTLKERVPFATERDPGGYYETTLMVPWTEELGRLGVKRPQRKWRGWGCDNIEKLTTKFMVREGKLYRLDPSRELKAPFYSESSYGEYHRLRDTKRLGHWQKRRQFVRSIENS